MDVRVRFTPANEPRGFNIIGEIRGRERPDEVVMIGAHFDSWHGATGATDNAAGSAAVIEVLRILKAAGLEPRRTIRFALWGDEEGGLRGSREYVAAHLGTVQSPKADWSKFSVYFNLDNGTGKIRGVWTQARPAAQAIFQEWAAPLRDLGVDLISPRWVRDTDHVPFDQAGIPAFQFVQERYEYNSRTHHTTMDFYDRLQADDLKQMAVVAASFVWQAATRPDLMPRTDRRP
jgi:Zn-dependent M28 family amino/carboxypeptidase